jgi:hypothetical protein
MIQRKAFHHSKVFRKLLAPCCAAATIYFVSPGAIASQQTETVKLYTYHVHPPFITGNQQGLTFELAQHLNSAAKGRFLFVIEPVSRPRLNAILRTRTQGVVPWVNPAWLGAEAKTKFTWSKSPIIADGNLILSRQSDPIEYTGPSSLDGRIFGGIFKHHYKNIDDYRSRTNKFRRIDASDLITNMRRLVGGRIDATLIPASAKRYLLSDSELSSKVYVSKRPHSKFDRFLMTINSRQDLHAFIDHVSTDYATGRTTFSRLIESAPFSAKN